MLNIARIFNYWLPSVLKAFLYFFFYINLIQDVGIFILFSKIVSILPLVELKINTSPFA